MAKFCIMSALKSEIASSGKKVCECDSKVLLVFDGENVRNATIHGCVIIFRCNGFVVDEEMSLGGWKNVFGYNTEGNDRVVITINPDYRPGIFIPYFG